MAAKQLRKIRQRRRVNVKGFIELSALFKSPYRGGSSAEGGSWHLHLSSKAGQAPVGHSPLLRKVGTPIRRTDVYQRGRGSLQLPPYDGGSNAEGGS